METCELCGRNQELSSHHLIPKQVHSKNWCKKMFSKGEMNNRRANLCKLCHTTLHKFFTHRELGEVYNTIEKLMLSEKIIKFLVWVKKQK